MVLFIGPEFVAHLLNRRPNGENSAGTPPMPLVRSGTFDEPTFLLKVRLTLTEAPTRKKNKGEIE
jgi:hypothetical protein